MKRLSAPQMSWTLLLRGGVESDQAQELRHRLKDLKVKTAYVREMPEHGLTCFTLRTGDGGDHPTVIYELQRKGWGFSPDVASHVA